MNPPSFVDVLLSSFHPLREKIQNTSRAPHRLLPVISLCPSYLLKKNLKAFYHFFRSSFLENPTFLFIHLISPSKYHIKYSPRSSTFFIFFLKIIELSFFIFLFHFLKKRPCKMLYVTMILFPKKGMVF